MTEPALSGPDAMFVRLLRGRRYDDPYPPDDIAFLERFAGETDDELVED